MVPGRRSGQRARPPGVVPPEFEYRIQPCNTLEADVGLGCTRLACRPWWRPAPTTASSRPPRNCAQRHRAHGRDAVPERSRHAGDVHREGAGRDARTRASPARSSSPTTAAPTARREIAACRGRSRRVGSPHGLRRRAHGRHRGRARPLHRSWATPTTATTSASSRSSSSGCARATTLCRAAGSSPAADASCPGAMPRLHRWLGNPMFSRIARRWFRAPIHDIYCGMRGFTKALYLTARPALHGHGIRHRDDHQGEPRRVRSIAEVPITLHPDGRKSHPPHLKTFRDGWRTLRFFLLCTPRWLFLMPGLLLLVAGPCRLHRGDAGPDARG